MDHQKRYQEKLGTLEGALKLLRSGDSVMVAAMGNEPTHFIQNLHTIAQGVTDVTLWTMLMMGDYPVMSDPSLKGHIDIHTHFYNRDCRVGHPTGRFHLMPMDLHATAEAIVRSCHPNVFVAAVSPMDGFGNFYLSFDLQTSLEALEAADTVILEVNPNIPRVCGETMISLERVDYLYEAATPLPELLPPVSTPEEKQIAEYVVSLIRDGDCIQLGIGGMPNAVGEALMDKQDLGIHTEMLTSSMGKLMKAGVVTNVRKNFNTGKSVAAFAYGDKALYHYMTENKTIMMRRAAWVNNPFNIALNDNMVSVNTAIELDLTGQICSESIGTRQYSGTGGATDFAWGAFHSRGGRGIIALTSTTKGGAVSKICPTLTQGAIVSISRNLADYIVTEYGIARLRGKTIEQRVDSLIAIAHPDFRAELRRQADKLMLW